MMVNHIWYTGNPIHDGSLINYIPLMWKNQFGDIVIFPMKHGIIIFFRGVQTTNQIYMIYIYIYEQGPPHPPPPPARWLPPPCGRGGGVFSAAKPIYAKYIAQCKECASNVQGTAWAALVSIHRNHGVCSLYSAYSAYSAYVSIIRMDILYVI